MKAGRRTALGVLLTVATAPMLASAQATQRRIAWFGAGRADTPSPFLTAFRAGMRDSGWIEGQNLALSVFLTDGPPEDAERLARQMLATNPEIIVVYGRNVAAVHRAKPPGPVVFAFSGNPVDAGFVQSFARPGGNFTGVSFMSLDLSGKRIELLRELVPQVRRLAVLARPEHPGEHRERAVSEEVIAKLGMTMAYVPIEATSGLDGALKATRSQDSAVRAAARGPDHRMNRFAGDQEADPAMEWSVGSWPIPDGRHLSRDYPKGVAPLPTSASVRACGMVRR